MRERAVGYALLTRFMHEHADRPMDEIIHQPIPCATLVADWVQVSFDNGDVSLGLAKNAVLGFLDRNWWLKGHFAIVWECLKSWEDGEPFDSRRPWPPVLLKGL